MKTIATIWTPSGAFDACVKKEKNLGFKLVLRDIHGEMHDTLLVCRTQKKLIDTAYHAFLRDDLEGFTVYDVIFK